MKADDSVGSVRVSRLAGWVALMLFAFMVVSGTAATFTVTNANDVGTGSLRQAILDANSTGGADTIAFAIPGSGLRTISLLSILPPIIDPVTIDGTTQPGYAGTPIIELNGASAGTDVGALRLLSGDSTVKGLILNRFSGDCIHVQGPGTNLIRGNYIGTDSTGTLARGNAGQGILIESSPGNIIGGTNAADANVISANGGAGVYVLTSVGTVIQGNRIGTTAAGTARLGNTNNGVHLYGSASNLIGGTKAGARNLISGNTGSGVLLYGTGTSANRIEGNYVGTDVAGTAVLSNTAGGVVLQGVSGNWVGGTNAGNVISGNGVAGIGINGSTAVGNFIQGNYIGLTAAGSAALANLGSGISVSGAISNLIGGASASTRNVISGNKQNGILLSTNSIGNAVSGNYIGINAGGTASVSNLLRGITVSSAYTNYVGGVSPAGRNVISGNGAHGIQIDYGSRGNVIQGNYIGTDPAGTAAVANLLSGIAIAAPANVVGGSQSGAGNLLSGNLGDGVLLSGTSAATNLVQGNWIGTTASGAGSLGNGAAGVELTSAPYNTIGGTIAGAGNVISANTLGVYLVNSTAAYNSLQGNKIGTDAGGTKSLGNHGNGVYLDKAMTNLIGGAVAGAGNLISANEIGIYLVGASWNSIQGNLVGTKIDGVSALGNGFQGVAFDSGANNNLVGGPSGAGNTIAYCGTGYAGVRVWTGGLYNRIVGNSIFSNGALGIDLGTTGVTLNDTGDADTGANSLQNFPVLTQAVGGPAIGIRGTLNSTANSTFLVQFFANSVADSTGYGEGQVYLGDKTVATAADGNASFAVTYPVAVPVGYWITATATDGANNTSEFSACLAATSAPRLSFSRAGQQLGLSWTNSPSGFVLKQTSDLRPPVQWTAVTNAVSLVNGNYVLSLPLGATNRFYALQFQ